MEIRGCPEAVSRNDSTTCTGRSGRKAVREEARESRNARKLEDLSASVTERPPKPVRPEAAREDRRWGRFGVYSFLSFLVHDRSFHRDVQLPAGVRSVQESRVGIRSSTEVINEDFDTEDLSQKSVLRHTPSTQT